MTTTEQQNDLHVSRLLGDYLIQIGEDKDGYSVHVYEELVRILQQETQEEPLDFENFEIDCLCGLGCGNWLTLSKSGLMISKPDGTNRFAKVDPRKVSAIYRLTQKFLL